jgi:serine/threonine protein kinase
VSRRASQNQAKASSVTWVMLLVVLLVLAWVVIQQAKVISQNQAQQLMTSANDSIAQCVAMYFESIGSQTRRIENVENLAEGIVSGDVQGIEPLRQALERIQPAETRSWAIFDRQSRLCISSLSTAQKIDGASRVSAPSDWSKLDAGKSQIRLRQNAESAAVADAENVAKFEVIVPIAEGVKTVGAVVLEIDPREKLFPIMNPQTSSSAHAMLVDKFGSRLSSSENRGSIVMTPMIETLMRGSSGHNMQGYKDVQGQSVVGVWRWIPQWNVGVATEMPSADSWAGIVLIRNAGLLALGTGLALIGLAWWASRRRQKYRREDHVDPGKPVERRSLGEYELKEPLGSGGMGTVYRARHQWLRREVALKVLEGHSLTELAISRFEREVQLTAKLRHPNTIAVYDFGRTDDGAFYYAMELVDGLTLQELIDEFGAQPPSRVIHLLLQVCGSIAEAHGKGLIHRDIKPANVLVSRGVGTGDLVKVVDFGLVKDINQSSDISLTRNDSITGTPMYMSPEAVRDAGDCNTQSDLYSIAAVGYTLLAGRPMFDGESSVEICVHQIKHIPALPQERLGKPLPADLQSVLMTGLRKDPADRWLSVEDFAAALRGCEDVGFWNEAESEAWWAHTSRMDQQERRKSSNPNITLAQKTLS